MLGMGLGFELPVVILTLVKIDILTYRRLRSMWRYMIVINLILGALLTTPEVITQILMAGPLYMLYEITKARRSLALMTLLLLALAAAVWAGWHYGWPLVRQRWH